MISKWECWVCSELNKLNDSCSSCRKTIQDYPGEDLNQILKEVEVGAGEVEVNKEPE